MSSFRGESASQQEKRQDFLAASSKPKWNMLNHSTKNK
jgi:hypothetical protein